MRAFFLTAATLALIINTEAREHWGPPSACPQPKADCCPNPCAKPARSAKAQSPKAKPAQSSKGKECPPSCDPCCPPVCFEQGHEASDCCIPPGYTQPASIDLRCGLNLFVTAGFTYWNVMQDGMDLALPGQSTSITHPISTGNVTLPATGRDVLYQDNSFKPGFQLGMGWSGGRDGWTLYGEYSWVRGSTHTSAQAPAPGVSSINGVSVGSFGVWIPTSWFPSVYNANITTSLSSKWEYGLDIADLQLSRPSYVGTHFVLEPLFGLRGLWIRQSLNIISQNLLAVPSRSRTAHYKSDSWAVGPRAGFNGKWHLGYGLRFIGDSALSLLYTRYTEVSQEVGVPEVGALPLDLRLDDYGTLRPNLDFSLGFGWGSYLFCRRFHVDLAATYDFSIFWQQNMMRYLADLTADLTAHPDGSPSSLYIQGLTIKAEFEF